MYESLRRIIIFFRRLGYSGGLNLLLEAGFWIFFIFWKSIFNLCYKLNLVFKILNKINFGCFTKFKLKIAWQERRRFSGGFCWFFKRRRKENIDKLVLAYIMLSSVIKIKWDLIDFFENLRTGPKICLNIRQNPRI